MLVYQRVVILADIFEVRHDVFVFFVARCSIDGIFGRLDPGNSQTKQKVDDCLSDGSIKGRKDSFPYNSTTFLGGNKKISSNESKVHPNPLNSLSRQLGGPRWSRQKR